MRKNRIAELWNYLTLPLAILGLSGLSGNLVTWYGFLKTIIDNWHSIVLPVWIFLFSWIPIQIPTMIYDYLTFGTILGSIQVKIFLPIIDAKDNCKERVNNSFFAIFMFFSFVFFWPYQIYATIFYRFSKNQSVINQSLKEMSKIYFEWLSYIAVGFLMLLSINYIISFP